MRTTARRRCVLETALAAAAVVAAAAAAAADGSGSGSGRGRQQQRTEHLDAMGSCLPRGVPRSQAPSSLTRLPTGTHWVHRVPASAPPRPAQTLPPRGRCRSHRPKATPLSSHPHQHRLLALAGGRWRAARPYAEAGAARVSTCRGVRLWVPHDAMMAARRTLRVATPLGESTSGSVTNPSISSRRRSAGPKGMLPAVSAIRPDPLGYTS